MREADIGEVDFAEREAVDRPDDGECDDGRKRQRRKTAASFAEQIELGTLGEPKPGEREGGCRGEIGQHGEFGRNGETRGQAK